MLTAEDYMDADVVRIGKKIEFLRNNHSNHSNRFMGKKAAICHVCLLSGRLLFRGTTGLDNVPTGDSLSDG